ncbi:MAG: hypothetical protein IKJ30_00290 [Bacilli bacterium]|nr:hypothetical protein [Bacilli bacterium]
MEDEIIKYQKKLKKWIMKPNWDDIAERLSPSLMSIVTIVMNAKSEKDVSPLVYRNIDYTLERIENINNSLKKGTRRRQ